MKLNQLIHLSAFVSSTSWAMLGGLPASGTHTNVVAITNQRGLSCTGTLVTPRLVITAAHCLTNNGDALSKGDKLEDYRIYLGDGEFQNRLPEKKLHGSIEVLGVGAYPRYLSPHLRADSYNTFASDLGFMVLKGPIHILGPYAQIDPQALPAIGESLTGVGFGFFTYEAVQNPTPENSDAGKKLAGHFPIEQIQNLPQVGELILNDLTSTIQGLIYGDSGGPLFLSREDEAAILLGVASKIAWADFKQGWAKLSYNALCFIEANAKTKLLKDSARCPKLKTYRDSHKEYAKAYKSAERKCKRSHKICVPNSMAFQDAATGRFSQSRSIQLTRNRTIFEYEVLGWD